MARQRRGGGFRPPELRGTLGTLLRTTLEQAGAVRDALERGARSRFDEARAHRRRKDALADLGELVLDLIRRGEIDLTELPEAHDLIRLLDDLDADAPADPDDRIAQPPTRRRFDARSPDADPYDPNDGPTPFPAPRGRGRPPFRGAPDGDRPPFRGAPDGDRAPFRDDSEGGRAPFRGAPESDDGTVSATRGRGPSESGRWSPPRPSAPQRVWRPSLVEDEPDPRDRSAPHDARPAPRDARDRSAPHDARDRHDPRDPHPPRSSREPADARAPRDARDRHDPRDSRDLRDREAPRDSRDSRPARPLHHDPHSKGGIQFDDDEDLADYMHPDDVPPKPPSDDK